VNDDSPKTIFDPKGIFICFFFIFILFFTYSPVINHEFVNYDDDEYVFENPTVLNGISLNNMHWAFTTTYKSNWHPLTWMSHMLDVELFGLNAGMHHITNVIFHILNTLLLFILFREMTGCLWKSGFVAVLFAFHPMHVESVAWISERKDVLSTFWGMLTLIAYVKYVKRGKLIYYLLVNLFYIIGIMAKPMIVTIPFVMILLDYWPLNRNEKFGLLIYEKIPLFLISIVSCGITLYVQEIGGSIASLEAYPLYVRIANVLVSYASYMGKIIWPCCMAVFYPHPDKLTMHKVVIAFLLFVSLNGFAIKSMKNHPWATVGWLWYIGTLVPVIGLVQVGLQSRADRYTYLPYIGLFIIIVWGSEQLLLKWGVKKRGVALIMVIVLTVLTGLSSLQLTHWKNSIKLFTHAINVTDDNYLAHNNLGQAILERGGTDKAIYHFEEAIRIKSNFEIAYLNLGVSLVNKGKNREAISYYQKAIEIKPDYVDAYNNLGNAYLRESMTIDAVRQYQKALKIEPENAQTFNSLGAAMIRMGRIDDAIKYFKKAINAKPGYMEAKRNLAKVLSAIQKENSDINLPQLK